MASPYSPLTWARSRLAQWLEPYPDTGEAWCMGCVLNGGRTLVLNADAYTHHMHQHRELLDDKRDTGIAGVTNVSIRAKWAPSTTTREEEDYS